MRRRLFCNNDIVPVGCPSRRVPACLRVCVCVTLPSWPGPQKPAPGMADALFPFASALHALHHHHYRKKMDHSTDRMHRCPSAVPGSMERSFNCTTTTTTMTVMVTKLGLAFVSTAHGTDSGLIKRPGARRIGFGLAASRMWTINGKCSPFPMLLGLKRQRQGLGGGDHHAECLSFPRPQSLAHSLRSAAARICFISACSIRSNSKFT